MSATVLESPVVPSAGVRAAVLTTTSVSGFMVFGSAGALSVAIPSMSATLAGGADSAAWMILAFLLGNSAAILVFAKLSDLLGRRWFYLGGVIAFLVGSLVCCLASSDGVLIAARAVQGLAAASAVANSTAVLSDVIPLAQLPLVLGLNVTIGGLSTLAGPLLGGLLLEHFDWRAVFVATLPLAAVAIGFGWRALAHVHAPPIRRFRFDLAGALLSLAGIGGVLLAGERLSAEPTAPASWLLLGGALLVVVVFAYSQSRLARGGAREPLLDPAVIVGPRALVYLASLCISFAFGSVVVLVALYLQAIRGASALEAGAMAVPMGAAMMIGAPGAGWAGRWVSARALTIGGGVLVAVGLGWLAVDFAVGAEPAWIVPALIPVGLGEGIVMAALTRRVMQGVAADRRAVANGFRSVLHNGSLMLSTAAVFGVVTAFSGSGALAGRAVGDPTGFVVAAAVLGLSSVAGAVAAVLWRDG
ncbi:MFS transporter [Rathayibacter sp. VKM Ac-2803]|uniref:MFS transporter n=1 Tax=unclassified Rathayibacter TaxID=2609250 RepID=UPI001357C685|nr:MULTISPECIES: MFS transporter [unclassified Rathayibacter]MWV48285.1 MFS transporter [Rathayibacter sp. VKM Ac-2803]MWV59222.1 MFS transporter [Rathayibacter sp. VKM Ac-2754]